MLTQATELVDELLYYDDKSDDDSTTLAMGFENVHTTVRLDGVPAFLEHEGKFRQSCWSYFEEKLRPSNGDWILAIDTDEVLAGTDDLRASIDHIISQADRIGADSVVLPIPEIFGYDDEGNPLSRVDGLWGRIRGFRLFRYRPGGVFKDKSMGCGSEPTYVENGPKSQYNEGVHLVHFGYADPRDRIAKYRRYTDLLVHGHNDSHVRSIIATPTLQPCRYAVSLKRAR